MMMVMFIILEEIRLFIEYRNRLHINEADLFFRKSRVSLMPIPLFYNTFPIFIFISLILIDIEAGYIEIQAISKFQQ
jgi:hypothetical protein